MSFDCCSEYSEAAHFQNLPTDATNGAVPKGLAWACPREEGDEDRSCYENPSTESGCGSATFVFECDSAADAVHFELLVYDNYGSSFHIQVDANEPVAWDYRPGTDAWEWQKVDTTVRVAAAGEQHHITIWEREAGAILRAIRFATPSEATPYRCRFMDPAFRSRALGYGAPVDAADGRISLPMAACDTWQCPLGSSG